MIYQPAMTSTDFRVHIPSTLHVHSNMYTNDIDKVTLVS